MSDQEPLNMLAGPPTVHEICMSPEFCANQNNIVEALGQLFDDWPKFLGRCQLCVHFREIDFKGTSTYS